VKSLKFHLVLVIMVSMTIRAQVFVKVTNTTITTDSSNSYFSAWGDYDKDGDLDLFVPIWFGSANNATGENYLYQNNCNGNFAKVTAMPGGIVTDEGAGFAGFWIDYNNDGDLDLYVWSEGANNSLYKNNGNGSFSKITTSITSSGPSETAAWVDFDNDGKLDVFSNVPNGANSNRLYKGNGNGNFTLITAGDMYNNATDNASGCAWGDYDSDGYMDLYIANTLPSQNNSLYHNNGGSFSQVTGITPATDAFFSYGCAWADYDNDLDLDLYVSNSFGNEYLYRNNGDGTFTNIATTAAWTSMPSSAGAQGGAAFADYDNDGDLDILIPNFGQNFLMDNNGNGTFSQNTTEIVANDQYLESYGVAWNDYDNDGDMDLFVPTAFGDANDLFYINTIYQNVGNSNNWFKAHLIGASSNRDGIGARVYVKATINGVPKWQMREINANSTRGGESGGASSHVAHIGLGDASVIDSLKIVWPASGFTKIFTNVSANQFYDISENQNNLHIAKRCNADLPVANPGFVTGNVFHDFNGNCINDSVVDSPLASKLIKASPGEYFTLSDENGDYKFNLPAGAYIISAVPEDENFKISDCQPDEEYSVTVTNGNTSANRNFSFETINALPCVDPIISLPITYISLSNGLCIPGTVLSSPCPNNLGRYCFPVVNSNVAGSAATSKFSTLVVTLPAGFAITAIQNACNCTVAITGNVVTFTFPFPINPGAICTPCITYSVTNAAGSGPYTTSAIFTNKPLGLNLVVNGDFSNGNTGFTSDLTNNCTANTISRYCVTNTTAGQNAWWSGTGNPGNFMITDNLVNNNAWCETVNVNPNTDYSFGFDVNNLIKPSIVDAPGKFDAVINGVPLFTTAGVDAVPDIWRRFTGTWCSENNATADICIVYRYGPDRSDFGLDNISFRSGVTAQGTLSQEGCSCDPNEKTVTPKGCGAEGNIAMNEELSYQIHFENIGLGNAHNIIIRDILDTNLDVTTLRITESSHTITNIEIIPGNELIISFDSIELAGISYPDSNKGFVNFLITPKTNRQEGTQIVNQAGIYFDQNEVVLTDNTVNTLRSKPIPSALFSSERSCSNAFIYNFNYSGDTPDSATYYWDFGSGSTPSNSTDQNPVNIIYDSAGVKLISLTLIRFGCSQTFSDTVVVHGADCGIGKTLICHHGRQICVNNSSLADHVNHGDCVGECPGNPNSKVAYSEEQYDKSEVQFSIAPNPANETATITLEMPGNDNVDISMYNYLGEKVRSIFVGEVKQRDTRNINFTAGELSDGIYFVVLKTSSGIFNVKFVLRK
jgi:enediyne biosynthesis protein E4